MCSKKSRKIQGIAPVLESLFNKEIKKALQYRCFPVNFGKFLRSPF